MDAIKPRQFAEADRQTLRDRLARDILADPEPFIERYIAHPHSHAGRFVNSDLFKETFPDYSLSAAHRARYDLVVHDPAAVLAAEQFRRVIQRSPSPGAETAVFLTGAPGAGKTTRLLTQGYHSSWHVVLEGQLANQGAEKIAAALDRGLAPEIVVVHTTPELALDSALNRFHRIGRGASVEAIASILARLPHGLQTIRDRFGDRVALVVVDNRDRSRPSIFPGWRHLSLIASEGDYANVHRRIRERLEVGYIRGDIGVAAYEHTLGRAGPPIPHG